MQRIISVFCLVATCFAAQTYGQLGLPGRSDGVTASGSFEIKVRPEFLQMTIQVEGRSSDLPQAADELKRRVVVAKQRLKDLGAIPESVTIARPQLAGSSSPQQSQQMQAMYEQYGGGRRGKQMLEETKSVSLTQSITARWPISGQDDIERLIADKMLTTKIRAADIASNADDQPVSAAQEELAAEMVAMQAEFGGRGEEKTKSGEPAFAYVARISQEKYEDALAAAFQRAQQKVKTLIFAAQSIDFDPSYPISSSIGSQSQQPYYSYGGNTNNQPQEDPETGDYELLAGNPNEATCVVTVTAFSKRK